MREWLKAWSPADNRVLLSSKRPAPPLIALTEGLSAARSSSFSQGMLQEMSIISSSHATSEDTSTLSEHL